MTRIIIEEFTLSFPDDTGHRYKNKKNDKIQMISQNTYFMHRVKKREKIRI